MRNKFKEWLGDGIFASDGAQWKKQRAFAKELFHSVQLNSHAAVFHRHAHQLCDRLTELSKEDSMIDMQDYCMRCGTICVVLFAHVSCMNVCVLLFHSDTRWTRLWTLEWGQKPVRSLIVASIASKMLSNKCSCC